MKSRIVTVALLTSALAFTPLASAQAHGSDTALVAGLFAAGIGTAIALSADSPDTVIVQSPPPARVYYRPAPVHYVYRPAPPRYHNVRWEHGPRHHWERASFHGAPRPHH